MLWALTQVIALSSFNQLLSHFLYQTRLLKNKLSFKIDPSDKDQLMQISSAFKKFLYYADPFAYRLHAYINWFIQ